MQEKMAKEQIVEKGEQVVRGSYIPTQSQEVSPRGKVLGDQER